MLTLLPPLVVCEPAGYNEEVQDTNRLTWDEDPWKVKDCKNYPLIYYRPVLVYGNQLHVAAKGLVGNSETEIKETIIADKPISDTVSLKQINCNNLKARRMFKLHINDINF